MRIRTLTVGQLEANCYIVVDENTNECVVIDPGAEGDRINDCLKKEGLKCEYIIATHSHADHIGALGSVVNYTGATFCMNMSQLKAQAAAVGQELEFNIPTIDLREGTIVTCGSMSFKVIETPGHSVDSICIICDNVIFTGDTLFKGECGASYLIPQTDYKAMLRSLLKIYELPGNLDVFPGHKEASTLDVERRTNPYMLQAYSLKDTED